MVTTYLCLATSTRTNEQTAVPLPTNDCTLEQVAELLVRSVVRRRVILSVHLNLVDLWRSLQGPQDGALLTFEQAMQMFWQHTGQLVDGLFPLLPFRLRR